MRYLGIDFGTKYLGLAVSDENGSMAFPHAVVENDAKTLDAILEVVSQKEIGSIVIGESKDYVGKENPVMRPARAFAERLAALAELPIHWQNEVLTSREATHIQGDNAMNDASAAAIMLQSYLDKNSENKNPAE